MITNHKKALLASGFLALGILAGCTSRSGPPAAVHYDRAVSPYHVVKRGESIASIARKYNMDKRELIRINGIESPYRIVKGQKLLVRAHVEARDDETEMPATESAGTVPDEDNVQVKPLDPVEINGEGTGSGQNDNGYASKGLNDGMDWGNRNGNQDYGRLSPDTAQPSGPGRGVDQPSRLPAPPAAASAYTQPVRGTIVRPFNPAGKGAARNSGINIAAARGTPVVAANNGVVAHSGNQLRGFGNVVLVKHDNGTMTVYAHLDKVAVKNGDIVASGQKIGTVGQTGTITEPQLHFEIRQGSKPLDPVQYLR